jgi:magnesium transporter
MTENTPPDVQEALRARDFSTVRARLKERYPADVAEVIDGLDEESRAVLFRVLPREQAAETFEYLAPEAQEGLLRALAHEQVASILGDMAPDDRTALLEELPAPVTRQLLALLSPEERQVARQLLGYPEKSIGRLMTPDFIDVRPDWTVQHALDHIRRHGSDRETLNVIYVVDERGKLIDDLRARQLLLADPGGHIADIMDGRFVALKATDDQEAAVGVFSEYDRVAFPVTDSSGVLLGIVTVDDVLDVAQEEATEDIQKIGGTAALDAPYLRVAFGQMVRKRAGWLAVLFVGEMLTATAMAYFQGEIARALVLALFVPLIISSGGNSGSQASTLVIRAMALGELALKDWWRVVRRELAAGLTLGAVLGLIGFLRIVIWQAVQPMYGPHSLLVALTIGGSLIGVVTFGTLAGSLLPFVLRGLGFDPASASAPFVATLVDVTGLVIYFTVASLVLGGTLL